MQNRDSRQKRHTQITQEFPLHQKPKYVPNIAPPHQEGAEVNTNILPQPYQVLPLPSQGLEANWEDISHPEGGTGHQPKRAMLENNPTTSSTRRSKRVPKPVDRLMMEIETLFKTIVKENQTRTITEAQGEIFCYQAMFPENFSDKNDNISHLNPLMAYKAKTEPDSMYLHETMHQENKEKFLNANL